MLSSLTYSTPLIKLPLLNSLFSYVLERSFQPKNASNILPYSNIINPFPYYYSSSSTLPVYLNKPTSNSKSLSSLFHLMEAMAIGVALIQKKTKKFSKEKKWKFRKIQKKVNKLSKKNIHSLLIGGIAGFVGQTTTAPLERISLLSQCSPFTTPIEENLVASSLFTLKQIYNREGIVGLFRGNLFSIIQSIPEASIKFFLYEKTKKHLDKNFRRYKKTNSFIAGSLGGLISNLAVYPFDALKTQIAFQKDATKSIKQILSEIFEHKGIFSLYKGGCIKAIGSIIKSGANLYIYDYMKGNNVTPLLSGCASSFISSTLLYPLYTLHQRANVLSKKKGVNDVFFDVVYNEGISGLFKGYSPSVIRMVLSNGISFAIYERMKKRI